MDTIQVICGDQSGRLAGLLSESNWNGSMGQSEVKILSWECFGNHGKSLGSDMFNPGYASGSNYAHSEPPSSEPCWIDTRVKTLVLEVVESHNWGQDSDGERFVRRIVNLRNGRVQEVTLDQTN